jgi:hypothetical protein
MTIKQPENPPDKGLTRFNGFELLAWDFNPRWAMRSSVRTISAEGLLNLELLSPGIVSVLFFSFDYGSADSPRNR